MQQKKITKEQVEKFMEIYERLEGVEHFEISITEEGSVQVTLTLDSLSKSESQEV